jgi:ketosteroid isomerase-like protein
MESEDRIRAAIFRYYAAVSRLDVETWLACFAADAVSRDPITAAPARTAAERRAVFAGLAALLDRFAIVAERVYPAGRHAAVQFRARGRGHNGRAVAFEGVETFAFDGAGRIVELAAYWDPIAVVATLMEGMHVSA